MKSLKILNQMGCTEDRLRQIFTATDIEQNDGKDLKLRTKWEKKIRSRISEGVTHGCKNSRHYQAADLAWDSTPIADQNIPLLMYAQGKIDVQRCAKFLEGLDCADEFLEKDKHNQTISINVPRLFEVSINLVRSFIGRRLAAQTARFSNLYPYFKYEPRGTLPKDKLRGELTSQRIEIMSDQFGYRPFFSIQTIRDALLYSYSLVFPTGRWHEEKQIFEKDDQNPSSIKSDTELGEPANTEARITKEGVEFYNPHPTRTFRDMSCPLSKINYDLGPSYLGYWDIVRAGSVTGNTTFFNRDKIKFSTDMANVPSKYASYFDYYFEPCRINLPKPGTSEEGFRNDAKGQIGLYADEEEDASLFLSHYFEKVNPKDMGIADYPNDVWVHLIVASDDTVVYGEWMPSTPAAYCGINVNDSKTLNNSMAHDIMPYQDQLSNIVSQMLLNMKAGLMKIYVVNEDVIDEDTKEDIKKMLSGEDYYVNPKALFVSLTKFADMGIDPKSVFQVVESSVTHNLTDSIRAIGQLLSLSERLLSFSPQELGQPAPREISAREVQEISNTTSAVFTSISESIDDQREAVKQILFESLLCCSSEKLELPTLGRYSEKVVKDAGFEIVGDSEEGSQEVVRRTVLGEVKDLRHDVIFSARDGAERFSNTQAAQVLGQLMGQVANIPQVMEKMGNGKLFEVFNEIFRLSGADVVLEEDEDISDDVLQAIKTSLQQLNERLFGVEQVVGVAPPPGAGGPPGAPPPGAPPPGAPPPV